jgi:hypothetical protein
MSSWTYLGIELVSTDSIFDGNSITRNLLAQSVWECLKSNIGLA